MIERDLERGYRDETVVLVRVVHEGDVIGGFYEENNFPIPDVGDTITMLESKLGEGPIEKDPESGYYSVENRHFEYDYTIPDDELLEENEPDGLFVEVRLKVSKEEL
jgi:hypothetical protein